MKNNFLILIFALFLVGTLNLISAQETCTYEYSATPTKSFECNSPNGCFAWIKDIYCNKRVGNDYFCRSFYDVTKNGLTENKFIEYSGTSAGYYGLEENQAVALEDGDKFELRFDEIIEYKLRVCSVCQCVMDKCEGGLIIRCTNINPQTGCGTLASAVSCPVQGEVCIPNFGECQIPFVIHLTLGNVIGESRDTFLPTEQISARARVDSYLSTYRTLVFSIYRGIELVSQKEIPTVLPMGINEYKYADFHRLAMGNYKMVVHIKGTDYKTEKTFSVSDTLCVRANFLDWTRFVTNKDIGLIVETMDSRCVDFIDIPNWRHNILVDATFDNEEVPFSTIELKTGTYQYNFNFPKTGTFKVDFTIQREFYPDVTIGKVQYIGQPEINIFPTFREFSNIGIHKITWNVFDEAGEKVSNLVQIIEIEPSIGKKEIITDIKEEGNSYYTEYYFKEGTYKVTIFASKEGYSSDFSSTLVDIVAEPIDEGIKDILIFVIIVVVSIVLLGGIFYLIWRKK